jgi:GNAT superfamily N-acetyltransferase
MSYFSLNRPSTSAVYVSRLAILPNYHRKGFGSALLKFAENKASQNGLRYVRLSAVAYHKKLTNFYLKRGYEIIGKIFGKLEGNLFEKELKCNF